jgi:hypothetical protein
MGGGAPWVAKEVLETLATVCTASRAYLPNNRPFLPRGSGTEDTLCNGTVQGLTACKFETAQHWKFQAGTI